MTPGPWVAPKFLLPQGLPLDPAAKSLSCLGGQSQVVGLRMWMSQGHYSVCLRGVTSRAAEDIF